ncbi:hypothetical protein DPEC_G00011190 [Dallia pectoralis]|uniref:Uncharacterized protein n=1 Tax=Dallia pectoralis TaxID=75939 RepID=A0ACC2HLW6_DALPE|nr:hypothetical protein DPEC_G00011190 [Dallia pectoralis]
MSFRAYSAVLVSGQQIQLLPQTLRVLERTPQVKGSIIRNRETSQDESCRVQTPHCQEYEGKQSFRGKEVCLSYGQGRPWSLP